jgi:DNA-binding transcriptional MerR regulator
MKIGELSRHTGLAASAIRYYERLGLVPAPHRHSGQRRYASEAAHRLLLICFAKDMDFTLDEMKAFLRGLNDKAPLGGRWKKLAQDQTGG